MKYVEAYYEGTEEAVVTLSDKTCECECCQENKSRQGSLAVREGYISEPIGCDGCTVEVEECSPAPKQFTASGADGLGRDLFRIGIQPHDLVAIVKLDELQAAQDRIAILRKGLQEIELHDAFDEHAGWMVNRAVVALKEADGRTK